MRRASLRPDGESVVVILMPSKSWLLRYIQARQSGPMTTISRMLALSGPQPPSFVRGLVDKGARVGSPESVVSNVFSV